MWSEQIIFFHHNAPCEDAIDAAFELDQQVCKLRKEHQMYTRPLRIYRSRLSLFGELGVRERNQKQTFKSTDAV